MATTYGQYAEIEKTLVNNLPTGGQDKVYLYTSGSAANSRLYVLQLLMVTWFLLLMHLTVTDLRRLLVLTLLNLLLLIQSTSTVVQLMVHQSVHLQPPQVLLLQSSLLH